MFYDLLRINLIFFHFIDKFRLNAGEHVFLFDISLPDFLPSTFQDDYGYVKYIAKVTIDISVGINQTNEIHFTVFSPFNLNNEPSLVVSDENIFFKFEVH